jgi:hypothetical protein
MNSLTLAPPRRRLWPWVLGAVLLLALLAVGSGLAWLMDLGGLGPLGSGWHDGVHIVLDGDEWQLGNTGTLLGLVVALVAGGGALLLGLLAVVVLVPLGLALALLGVALGVTVAVGAVLAVLAALLTPLWLPLLLLWLLLRRKPAAVPPAAAARMPA